MTRRSPWFGLGLPAGVLLALLTAGCSSGTTEKQGNEAELDLKQIGDAYGQALARLGRPPRSAEEIKPELTAMAVGDLNAVFQSPNDNQPYVIIWGVSLAEVDPTAEKQQVLAYERTGAGGTRYVLLANGAVVPMTAEEFAAATFPPGHRPPTS